MKRIAFSVWPEYNGNKPREDLEIVRDISLTNLQGKFKTALYTSFDAFDETSELLKSSFKNPPTKKDFVNWSDYYRICKILDLFEEGYDEVLYFDYDMLILEPPEHYGVAIEGHFEGESALMESTYKFWFLGVNSSYYLHRDHIEYLKQHKKLVQDTIHSGGGKVKFCYPMRSMYPIEENVGYIDGFYNFGSLDQSGFCTEEKSENVMYFASQLLNDNSYLKLNGVNMMGLVDNSQEKNIEIYQKMRDNNSPGTMNIESINEIIENCTKPLRVNYNSKICRQKILDFIRVGNGLL